MHLASPCPPAWQLLAHLQTPWKPPRPLHPLQAGEIHNFCHPNSLLTLQEYLNDYGDDEAKKIGAEVGALPYLNGVTLPVSGGVQGGS